MGEALVADTTVGFQFDTRSWAAPAALDAEERALLKELCSGEEAAYELLIDRFERPVFNLVSRLTDDRADAADVVQEVFLKVFRNVGSFRGDSSLKTWIYRIAVNEARNHRRWFGRHRKQEVGLETGLGQARGCVEWLTDPGRSPLEQTLDHEIQAVIEAALGELNPNFRAVLVLREIEGLSYEEIAEILEISLGTVKSRILRGREALRGRLAERVKQGTISHPGFRKRGWRTRELVVE
jgi:RNA polymerase sigma-70 factor (ECF subfamily)